VIVKINASGVCHTNEFARSGADPEGLLPSIFGHEGVGAMPAGTSRFSIGGRPVHHDMGCSTFANYTVLPEIALAWSART